MSDGQILDERERLFNEYAQFVGALAKPLPTQIGRIQHALIGLAGEVGEFADAYKKHSIYEKPLDMENVLEELGDLRFYMQMIINEGFQWSYMSLERPTITRSIFKMCDAIGLMDMYYVEGRRDWFEVALSRFYHFWKNVLDHFGLSPEAVIEANMEKLSKRYPNLSYSNEHASLRLDKAESPALVSEGSNVESEGSNS